MSYYFAELSRLLWEEAAFEPLKCRSASNPMLIVEAAGTFMAGSMMGGPGEANGTYTVECDGEAVVGPAMNVGALTATVLMIVAAVGLATLGVILLIVGLVLRASAKKRN